MTTLDLAVCDHLLTSTRSVRKRLDFERPVAPELIEECLEIAIQAPSASNRQNWHFVVVSDLDHKRVLADLYRKAIMIYSQGDARPRFAPNDPRGAQQPRVEASAMYLAEHMEEAPYLVIPCVEGRVEAEGVLRQASVYGSILPAVWSFMLALRSRGLGSAWTTLHLMYEAEAAQLLELPDDLTQAALLPVAYFTGSDFQRAGRVPAREVTHWNRFGAKR